MITRRDLLRASGFLSLTPLVPGFLARTSRAAEPVRDGRVLVVLQLEGGNDGINTVVPFGDEGYGKHRKGLRLPEDKLFKLAPGVGLHPSMRAAADLLESGRLAIVPGVGYPNPNRSHFESLAIWQTARAGRPAADVPGWLGRAFAGAPAGAGPALVHVGDESLPRALVARRASAGSFADASDLRLALPASATGEPPGASTDLESFVHRAVAGAYATAAELEAASSRGADPSARYPDTTLARRLELVARSLKSGMPARVFYVLQSGYDTHSVQLPAQAALLGELAGALKAFLDDLAAARLADRVLVLAFSEFGRRVAENGSLGTDHGTSGPVLLAGPAVRPGLIGAMPSLIDLEDGDLKTTVDFRRVYATVLEEWLDVRPEQVLGSRFETLGVLRA